MSLKYRWIDSLLILLHLTLPPNENRLLHQKVGAIRRYTALTNG